MIKNIHSFSSTNFTFLQPIAVPMFDSSFSFVCVLQHVTFKSGFDMEKNPEFIYCILCDYKAPKNRTDNLERHMQSHMDKTVKCECGAEMRPSSLGRHKKNSCPLESKQAAQKKKNHKSIKKINKGNRNEDDIMEYKIETVIRQKKLPDGSVIYEYDSHPFEFGTKMFSVSVNEIFPFDPSANCAHEGN